MKKLINVVSRSQLITFAACGNSSEKAESAADKEEVIVGLDDTFVPMGFQDDQGDIVGFDVDLAKAVLI